MRVEIAVRGRGCGSGSILEGLMAKESATETALISVAESVGSALGSMAATAKKAKGAIMRTVPTKSRAKRTSSRRRTSRKGAGHAIQKAKPGQRKMRSMRKPRRKARGGSR